MTMESYLQSVKTNYATTPVELCALLAC